MASSLDVKPVFGSQASGAGAVTALEETCFRRTLARPRWWKLVFALERVAAAAMLVAALPVLFCASFIIYVLSRRTPLVAHERVGRYGNRFWVVKLRTMWPNGAEPGEQHSFLLEKLQAEPVRDVKRPDDPRITSRFAALCRKYSIDELPQLWHVVQGRMALVGPRPMTSQELLECYGTTAWEVLSVKPGLTGLWQVRGRSRLNYRQRRRFDMYLVRNWSFRLYVHVLLATIPKVVTGRDAW